MENSACCERMEEIIDLCKTLWDSVALPDAFFWDRDSDIFADPAKGHPIDLAGRFLKVKETLSTVFSPQVHPVRVHAGRSPRGIAVSACFADHVLAAGKRLKQKAQTRRDLVPELRRRGRFRSAHKCRTLNENPATL